MPPKAPLDSTATASPTEHRQFTLTTPIPPLLVYCLNANTGNAKVLDVALSFLVNSLNGYVVRRTGEGTFGKADTGPLVDDGGRWALGVDSMRACLLSIEEERVVRAQLPDTRPANGRVVALAPELKLNLHVMFAARFQQYDQGLKYLSLVLTYFQSRSSFTRSDSPDLDPRIERLVVELQTLTFEQLNQVWAFVGGKLLPSAIYKIRMVVLQDREPLAIGDPITTLNIDLGRA